MLTSLLEYEDTGGPVVRDILHSFVRKFFISEAEGQVLLNDDSVAGGGFLAALEMVWLLEGSDTLASTALVVARLREIWPDRVRPIR